MVCFHLASLFLLRFCLRNYKIVFDVLIIFFFLFLISEYPVFLMLSVQIDARQGCAVR